MAIWGKITSGKRGGTCTGETPMVKKTRLQRD